MLLVRKDHVLLPSGVEIDDFYVIERSKIVYVIAITTDGLFVFEKQYRYGVDMDCLEICAGNIDHNETPIETAQRELLEETGYAGGEWEILSELAIDTSNMTEISYSILAQGVARISEPNIEKTEDIETILLTEEQVLESLKHGEIISALMTSPYANTSVSKLTSSPSIQCAITVTSIAQPVAHSPKIGQHWTQKQRRKPLF